MALLETGVFTIATLIAFMTLFISFKFDVSIFPILRLVSIILFFAMGLYLVSGFGIGTTTTNLTYNATNDLLFNETKTELLIPEEAEGMWLGYVFIVFAFIALFVMYLDFFRGVDE